jgi:hypothetical protein
LDGWINRPRTSERKRREGNIEEAPNLGRKLEAVTWQQSPAGEATQENEEEPFCLGWSTVLAGGGGVDRSGWLTEDGG